MRCYEKEVERKGQLILEDFEFDWVEKMLSVINKDVISFVLIGG